MEIGDFLCGEKITEQEKRGKQSSHILLSAEVFSHDIPTSAAYDDSYTEIKTIDIGVRTDFIRYDAASKKVLVAVSEGDSKTDGGIAVIDPTTNKRVETFKLDRPPEDFAIDASGQHIFANIRTSSIVDSIDRKTGRVTKWELNNAYKPTPMAMAEAGHRLFVVSRAPAVIVVLDTQTGKEIARLPMGCDLGISSRIAPDSERTLHDDESRMMKRLWVIRLSTGVAICAAFAIAAQSAQSRR